MRYENIDIYYHFRRAQSESKGRGFRMPKDFDAHLEKKFTAKNREALILVTKFFNVKWKNVEPYRYFQCGFELFKTFSYLKFFDIRVLRLYIEKDKNIKREMMSNKTDIVNSVKFIKKYMDDNQLFMFRDYLDSKNGRQRIVVDHYIKNNVDKFTLVWLVKTGKLVLTDDDRAYMPYIVQQYREICDELIEVNAFIRKAVERI